MHSIGAAGEAIRSGLGLGWTQLRPEIILDQPKGQIWNGIHNQKHKSSIGEGSMGEARMLLHDNSSDPDRNSTLNVDIIE